MKYRWSKKDKQDFHDNKLRASSIPSKKFNGPMSSEWDDNSQADPEIDPVKDTTED